MARNDSYSVSDLEKMLEKRRTELNTLEARRDKLAADLAECDSRISELNGAGTGSAGAGGGVRRGTKKKTKKVARKKAGGGRGQRTSGQPSLRKVIMDVLPSSGKAIPIDDVMEKVLATGYRSNAANFRQVVYLNLYNLAKKGDIKHDSKTKLYSA